MSTRISFLSMKGLYTTNHTANKEELNETERSKNDEVPVSVQGTNGQCFGTIHLESRNINSTPYSLSRVHSLLSCKQGFSMLYFIAGLCSLTVS